MFGFFGTFFGMPIASQNAATKSFPGVFWRANHQSKCRVHFRKTFFCETIPSQNGQKKCTYENVAPLLAYLQCIRWFVINISKPEARPPISPQFVSPPQGGPQVNMGYNNGIQ